MRDTNSDILSDLEYMRLHTSALYLFDSSGRMMASNQFNGGAVPRFHLARTPRGNYGLFRADVPDSVVRRLRALVDAEPYLEDVQFPPRYRDDYLDILAQGCAVEDVWHGPAYRFPHVDDAEDRAVVAVDVSNRDMLADDMPDWLEDVPHRQPFMALTDGGRAVAVCASVRITREAHEAGVETTLNCRRRGYARRVVAGWAKMVRNCDAHPLYSTSWENEASQAVARSLGLMFIGTDFHIR